MFRHTVLPFCLLAALAAGAAHAAPHTGAARGAHDGPRDAPADAPPPHAPAGYDVGYDYVIAHDPDSGVSPYYQFQGPPPTDPRSREQEGLRDGTLPIAPLTPYYAGVRLYGSGYGYGYGYGSYYDGCGCARYDRRYTVYYDDYGNRGASYPGYSHRGSRDYGRGYGD